MGYTVKRVPLNFNHPLHEVWTGYLNPYLKDAHTCIKCDGTGRSLVADILTSLWFGSDLDTVPDQIAQLSSSPSAQGVLQELYERIQVAGLLSSRRGWQFHLEEQDIAALIRHQRLDENPSPDEVEEYLTRPFGPDAVDRLIVIEARCEQLGLSSECDTCDGLGKTWLDPAITQAYKNWAVEEPPVGEGWQLWETVSEGSPVSLVFPTRDELARWLTEEMGYSEIEAQATIAITNHPTYVASAETGVLDGLSAAPSASVGDAPTTDDIAAWLHAQQMPSDLLLIHYENRIPEYAVTREQGQHITWRFCYSRWRARLFRTVESRTDPIPLSPRPGDWIAENVPLAHPEARSFNPNEVTFAPERLWENSDEAPKGCYWHEPLASWIENPDDPDDPLLTWHQRSVGYQSDGEEE